jgi:hypothetical protein
MSIMGDFSEATGCDVIRREKIVLSDPAKTRDGKLGSETKGPTGASVAQFATRRPGGICEMPRYRADLKGHRPLAGGDRTGWPGRRDSKRCIPNDRHRSRALPQKGCA